jgi:hypothetical protein
MQAAAAAAGRASHHSPIEITTVMSANKLINFNFHLSVWLSILGGIAALYFPDFILPDEESMYGPLRNNILFVIGYLMFGQIGLWYFRYLRGSRFEALFMAYTFFATAAGAKFYGEVNDLPVSNVFVAVLIYLAISHGLYYFAGRNKDDEPASERM